MIEVKKAHELDVVELTEDLPEYGLRRGAQGTVVEVFDNPEEAYMIEFLEDSGATSKIADWVKPNQIKNIDAIAKEYYARGMSYLQSGQFLEASRELRQAVDLIPSYIRGLHESLAKPLGRAEDWPKFIFAMRFIRWIDASYEFAKNNLAIAYLNYGVEEANKGDYEHALSLFYLALNVESHPDIVLLIRGNIATSHIVFGVHSHKRGDFESAVKHFQTAYTFNPDERTRYNLSLSYANLAKFYVSIGKFEDAINYYLMAEDAGLITPAILNNHAIALAISGDEIEAMMIFESALNLAPGDKTILANISKLTSKTAPDFVPNDIATEFSPIPPMKAAEPSITL